jgi:hypothetical protein
MVDGEDPNREEREPQAPKFMRPQRPVLDEPLDGAQDEPEPLPQVRGEGESSEIEPTQEITPATETPDDVEPKAVEPQPASPYFPRGIYEDAESVEAYYGRGEREKVSESPTAEETFEGDGRTWPRSRLGLAALIILLILALMMLVLTKGIPLNLF